MQACVRPTCLMAIRSANFEMSMSAHQCFSPAVCTLQAGEPTAFNSRAQPELTCNARAFTDSGRCASLLAGQEAGDGAEFKAREMSSVTFAELGLRAGAAAGYSLCHQGCCEHQIAVSDVRRLHAHDPQRRSAYPLVVFQVCSHD